MKKAKRLIACLLAFATLLVFFAVPISAYNQATYYRGWDIRYSGKNVKVTDYDWGIFNKYHEDYYHVADHFRCISYYHND